MDDRDLERIENRLSAIDEMLRAFQISVEKKLSELSTKVDAEASNCPYREKIARAANNIARLEQLEKRLHELELAAARAGAIGGGTAGAVIAAVYALGKLLGWW